MVVMKVFPLWHVHEFFAQEDDVKLIGIYSSREQAQLAAERAKSLPGFRDHPERFQISEYELDRDHWLEGFVTVLDDDD